MGKLNWSLINSLGKLKISKSSYYYLVIVPVLVKFTEYLNNPLVLIIGDSPIKLNIDLPFSWYLFYCGAVLIAIGTFIYQIFCPNFIKRFQNYGEFLDAGESDNYLTQIESKYARGKKINKISLFTKPYLTEKITHTKEYEVPETRLGVTINSEKKKEEFTTEEYKVNIKYQEERKDYFNELYSIANIHGKPLIIIALIAYIIGFLAFLFVIIQNIFFVINKLV